ncbi:hypothetical protein ACFPOI_07685 [Nonomuraea angiospora]|uniref:Uncharacterized protein n=1 Tax=Nonomuraea angiospora TaxID=46172 RepID=A0ABR9MDD1_9ACTN|nr:hypothetical protein [Nonomuraea angiospora]MBE1590903.1 hypothetical protein [Nonomuraea angiospora]
MLYARHPVVEPSRAARRIAFRYADLRNRRPSSTTIGDLAHPPPTQAMKNPHEKLGCQVKIVDMIPRAVGELPIGRRGRVVAVLCDGTLCPLSTPRDLTPVTMRPAGDLDPAIA